MLRTVVSVLITAALFAGTVTQRAEAAAVYRLAVVPQNTPTTTHRDWKPFADELGRRTGLDIQIQVFRTFDEFETTLTNGLAELAYMNPYHQVIVHKTQGYIPLVRDAQQNLAGVLVVPINSPVKSVRDLQGKIIGFPDPNAFAASLYMRTLLGEKEKIKFTARYLTSHANVYRHTIVGQVDAGSGVNRTLARERPQTRDALRVLYETPATASHPLSAHPRVPGETREALIRAIQSLAQTDSGRQLLKNVQLDKPVRADFERDYLPLDQLRMQNYGIRTKLPAP